MQNVLLSVSTNAQNHIFFQSSVQSIFLSQNPERFTQCPALQDVQCFFVLLYCKSDTQTCVPHHPPSHLNKQHEHVHPIAGLTWHASALYFFPTCFFWFGFVLIWWRVSTDDATSGLTHARSEGQWAVRCSIISSAETWRPWHMSSGVQPTHGRARVAPA